MSPRAYAFAIPLALALNTLIGWTLWCAWDRAARGELPRLHVEVSR